MAEKKYKVTYFDVRGLGEPIRYMLALGGADFEDMRMDYDEWTRIKPNTPFGQAPTLEFDGEVFGQTKAICRYLGSQFGLLPESDLDKLRADSVIDTLEDVRSLVPPIIAAQRSGDTETKEKLAKKYETEQLPPKLEAIEKYVKSEQFVAGDELSWADVFLAAMILFIESAGKVAGFATNLEKYPKICGIRKNVESQPRIAAFIAARKPTAIDL